MFFSLTYIFAVVAYEYGAVYSLHIGNYVYKGCIVTLKTELYVKLDNALLGTL